MVELLAASGDLVGDPRPITHPVKFYERGDRPLEIVTSRQWFIRNGGRDEALRRELLEPGRAARLAPALHAGPLRRLGATGSTATGWSAASASSACPFPVWYPLGPDGEPDHASPIVPDEASLPDRPDDRRARGLHPGAARRAGRVRGRPRRHGHLGHLVGHPADRLRLGGRPGPLRGHLPDGPAPAGARDHPHLALLHAAALAPGARRPALAAHDHQRLDPRPGPQEDVQVEGQRRSRPWRCSRSSAPTPCATGPATAGPGPTPRSTPAS